MQGMSPVVGVGPADTPVSTYFLSCNRNKESIRLDLKSDDGRNTLEELIRRADVLVESAASTPTGGMRSAVHSPSV